ncbi:Fe(2+) transporter permease subunit FeoB [Legionella impletisoli]|uniref:Ferrous iron transport protein B n=1 Tax=Legionella impletisoli TaxID=343510 RepID=A0A917JW68_9GAMM|nr:Fe(2+) transporter permease subunit FeoB [Legionella impletisoli]GGI88990.1 ferrous iron transport protein B [Legionella impletisoli]
MTHVMLVGNPNCGKTTLFNALTGENQRIGNWPGVTVEKKTGTFIERGEAIQITDLPGVYSLALSASSSQDERITARSIVDEDADLIMNVIDACHLERHLYLTSQLLELGKPMIIALNMCDIAKQRGISIDTALLSERLNCPVIALEAHKSKGIEHLKSHLPSKAFKPTSLKLAIPQSARDTLRVLEELLLPDFHRPALVSYIALRVLEGDTILLAQEGERMNVLPDSDILMADARYRAVHELVQMVQSKSSDASEHLTAKIDRLFLHRIWALPIFLGIMYLMFLFAINIGGAFQSFIDITTDAIFVQGLASVLNQLHTPNWLIALCAYGIGKGINTTLTFIPVIAAMFFILSFLELSGYMARAAFVVDKLMRILGLPGKSFVPMIVGFGCNVPAIMAARTLDSERDRLLTVLMSPFMSCSARLAIYAVFVAAFFPTGGQNVVFSLYLIGILMAVLTGFLLRKTMLRGQPSSLIIELPAYHRPSWRRLAKETYRRLRHFIFRAGKLIIPVCIFLGILNSLTLNGGMSTGEVSGESLLSQLGQWLTPLFYPMGLSQENWPATVGLLTGMLAKEVVVGSLNTLYAQAEPLAHHAATVGFDFFGMLQEALWSIPQNFASLGQALMNPFAANVPDGELSQTAFGAMYSRFDGKAGAYAYLLFILLYIPCVSTMAAIRQEANRTLMWFSIAWSLIVAYAMAVLFYQCARFVEHPQQTLLWLGAITMTVYLFVTAIYYTSKLKGGVYAYTNP